MQFAGCREQPEPRVQQSESHAPTVKDGMRPTSDVALLGHRVHRAMLHVTAVGRAVAGARRRLGDRRSALRSGGGGRAGVRQ
jgi:hypothetical protein